MKNKLKQVGFYFRRLKKERVILAAATVLTVFAIIVQSFAVFNQPETVNAAPNANDVIYGGCYSKQCYLDAYDKNTQGFRELVNERFGITREEIAAASWGNERTGNWRYSFGRTERYQREGSLNVNGTVYYYGHPPSPNYVGAGLWGHSAHAGAFGFLAECGNLYLQKIVPPPAKPSAKCEAMTVSPTTGIAGKTEFNFHIGGLLYDGAAWSGYYMNYSKDGGAWTRGISASLNPNGTGGAYNNGAKWLVTFKDPGTYKVQGFLNTTNAGNDITADACVKTVTVTAPVPSYDLAKTVDKPTAKPGDTLVYTLKFTNTGQVDLTNVIIKDQLPSGVDWTNVDINVNNGSGITDKEKLFESGVKIAIVKVGGTVTIKVTVKVKDDAVEAKECGENKGVLVNKASAVTREKQTEDRTDNNQASTTVIVNRECLPNFDIEKTVDKKTAKPGETVKYTLTFKNTGEIDLTNVVVKDVLPGGVSYVAGSVAATMDGQKVEVKGDLFADEGLQIAKVAVGKTVVITFNAKIADKEDFVCGKTILENVVSSGTSELVEEPNTDNNKARTEVDKDCPAPKDNCTIPGKEHLAKNDPDCVIINSVTPPPVNPPVVTSTTVYTPATIVSTGPAEAIAGVIAAGALTFGGAAYIASRRAVRDLMMKR